MNALKKSVIPFLFFLLLLLPFVYSVEQPLEVVMKKTYEVYAGEITSINVTLINNQDFEDRVYISVWPPIFFLELEKYSVKIPPHGRKSIILRVLPPITTKIETKEVKFNVFSERNPNIVVSKSFFLDIKKRSGVFLSSIYLDREVLAPGDVLHINVVVTNLNPNETKVSVLLQIEKDGKNFMVKEISKVFQPKTSETITFTYPLERYQSPGEYFVRVTLLDELRRTLGEVKESFTVRRIFKPVKEKKIEYGFLQHIVTIMIRNDGNEPLRNFTIVEYAPMFLKEFFYPDTPPEKAEVVENKFIVRWRISELSPGETYVTVSYTHLTLPTN